MVVLVSDVKQRELAGSIHIPLLSWTSVPPPHPTPLGDHRTLGSAPLC